MTDRDSRHNQLHYASILPSNTNAYPNQYQRYVIRRSSEPDRSKALYVDFENAFEDQNKNEDYFGFQPVESNVHLQSVQMISEVQNTHVRYHSRPSTPSDTPPHLYRSRNRRVHYADNHENIPPAENPNVLRLKTHSNISLPQYFLVKYLGRTACRELWGTRAVRTPIDDMVRNARQLPSINELPTLEACVNTRGLTLTHRQSPTHSKQHHHHHHGLIPLNHISYAMHDLKYSKIASCIVLRQVKSLNNEIESIPECYTFLFQSKDDAHRFALTFAQAFSDENFSHRTSRDHHDEKGQGRSRHRSNHQRMHYPGKSNDHHHHHARFLDSQV